MPHLRNADRTIHLEMLGLHLQGQAAQALTRTCAPPPGEAHALARGRTEPNMHPCDANVSTTPGEYKACAKMGLWEIILEYSRGRKYEYACSRTCLAQLVASIAIYGLCDFIATAMHPRAFGPEAR